MEDIKTITTADMYDLPVGASIIFSDGSTGVVIERISGSSHKVAWMPAPWYLRAWLKIPPFWRGLLYGMSHPFWWLSETGRDWG
jgi:hypothetical protein